MEWEDIDKEFDIEIPEDIPVFPVNVVCDLLHMQYHLLHEIMKAGILREKRKKAVKKLFSKQDLNRLKYIQYLIEERGVNIKGVKIILEMHEE
jgi:MerR family transcriptional regulator/heat shock protein HspR